MGSIGNPTIATVKTNRAANSAIALAAERDYSATNYQSLPIVFARAQGAEVWDPEGKHYLDFHSASTALNHGHWFWTRCRFAAVIRWTMRTIISPGQQSTVRRNDDRCVAIEGKTQASVWWNDQMKSVKGSTQVRRLGRRRAA